MAPSRPQVHCVNYYSRGTYGDERRFARLVAERNNFPLLEYRQNFAYSFAKFLDFPPTASPITYLFKVECDEREIALAHEVGATARFTGTMGDILFQMPPALPSATEYLQRRGFDRRFLSIALEAAQLDRVSIWKIIGRAFRDGLISPPTMSEPGEFDGKKTMLLTSEAARAFSDQPLRFIHPWLHALTGVPFGKFAQISCLGFNSAYFNALHEANESELIHPFLSEPIMELCLRIPTYLLMHGGWDRAMAREAFQSELPPEVRARPSKGSMNLWVREMIATNAQFVRELLLDGVLVREKIIDRKRLEDCFPGTTSRSPLSLGCFLDCVAAESWCRVWIDSRRNRAAA